MTRWRCERFDFRQARRTAQIGMLCLLVALLASACAPTRSPAPNGAARGGGAPSAAAASVACAAPSATAEPTAPADNTPTASTTGPADDTPPTAANPDITADCAGLHIEATAFTCGLDTWVLASSRLTYDAGEIQQIQNFLNSTSPNPPLPATLRQVSMGNSDVPCSISVAVTNTSSHAIQVTRMGVQLLAPSHQNTYTYRLLDACSILTPDSATWNDYCPMSGQGSQPLCNTFYEQVTLKPGVTGAVFDGAPLPETPSSLVNDTPVVCPTTMTLNPTDTDVVGMDFRGAAIYPVALHLSLLTASGPQTVALSQFPSTLMYATASNLQCYQLTGQTFSLELTGDAVLTDPATPPYHDCI